MIQKVMIFMIAIFISYGCAVSKKAVDISIGEWEYVVIGTPDGDKEGTLSIVKDGDNYTATLSREEGDTPLNNVVIENDELVATFDIDGYTIDITGKFVGNTFTGKVSVEYNEFPMTAVRKQ